MTTPHSPVIEMSYFRLSLLSYLRDSHPDKATDRHFIATRGDAAASCYSEVIRSGGSHDQAEETACQILYEGLHFSPYRMVVRILWDEFTGETDPDAAEGLARKLMPRLQMVFEKYTCSDDFIQNREYTQLYTETVGAIQTFLEDGIQ